MSEWRQTINKEQIISDLDEYVMEGKRAGLAGEEKHMTR